MDDNKMIKFESPGELGRYLFDRAVKPSDTGTMRLRLAVLSAVFARHKWNEIQNNKRGQQ